MALLPAIKTHVSNHSSSILYFGWTVFSKMTDFATFIAWIFYKAWAFVSPMALFPTIITYIIHWRLWQFIIITIFRYMPGKTTIITFLIWTPTGPMVLLTTVKTCFLFLLIQILLFLHWDRTFIILKIQFSKFIRQIIFFRLRTVFFHILKYFYLIKICY